MNRRSFFNFLGSAVIGTVIALKLPDNLVPTFLPVEKDIEASFKLTHKKFSHWLAQKQFDAAHKLYCSEA